MSGLSSEHITICEIEIISIGNKVKVVIPTADTLVTRLQQMLMLVDHAEAKVAIHCYYELWESH